MGGLKVGIVGAGIAGLAAGIGLKRAGHDVELFERSDFRSELGAAIGITPNGSRVLRKWGIDARDIGGVACTGIKLVNGNTLEPMMAREIETERYAEPFWMLHRVDLHQKLRQMVQQEDDIGCAAARIRLGSQVMDVDCENGKIVLAEGAVIEKDLIIIADGVKSGFVHKITNEGGSIYSNGMSAFRALIPFSKIDKFPDVRAFFNNPPSEFWAAANLHPDYRKRTTLVAYPCRNGEILNLALLHATRDDQPEQEDWHADAPTQAMLDLTQDFHPTIQSLFKLAPEIKIYTLLQRKPLGCLNRGKAIILGDASALMQPKTSQGGTIAFEHAVALERIFANTTSDQVIDRANVYNEFMHPHVLRIQLWSDWTPAMGNNKIRQKIEKLSKMPVPPMDASEFSTEVFDYLWKYNVYDELDEFMARQQDQTHGNAAWDCRNYSKWRRLSRHSLRDIEVVNRRSTEAILPRYYAQSPDMR